MITLTLPSKGQVTSKQALLRLLGIKPGQKIKVDTLPDGRAVIQAEKERKNIGKAFGMLKEKNRDNIILSIEEMNNIAREGWASEE